MRRIERDEAVAEVRAARGDASCLVCALRDGALGPLCVLERTPRATAVLTRYALREGHALVLVHRHVERFGEVDPAAWSDAAELARRVAVALERVLGVPRCYVAALGSDAPQTPMTSPHLHLHVVPLDAADARPSEVLTWQRGVLVPEDGELEALGVRLRG